MPAFQVVPSVLQGTVRWLRRSTRPLWLLVPAMLMAALPGPGTLAFGEPAPTSPAAARHPANGENASAPSPGQPTRLPPVTVVASPEESLLTGKSVLARETMEVLPENNGSINEQLRILPGVQFGEESRSSLQGGEILPPEVSIVGGKVYQNDFTIDGFDHNSHTDPAFDDPKSLVRLPGHPQALFLDSDLVEEVHLYDHNVSAEFGSFTGGVVDARTRDPGTVFLGTFHYRTTSDRWSELHVDGEDKQEFENSRSPSEQPEFEKHDGGLVLDLPLGKAGGVLASYQRLQSSIPLRWLDGEKTDRRVLENFFAKYLYASPSGDLLRLTLIHAPYDEERVYRDSIGGDYSLEGESSSALLSWNHPLAWGDLEMRVGYRHAETCREGVPYLYAWANTQSRNWGAAGEDTDTSFEGGPGPLQESEQGWQGALILSLDPVATGLLEHRLRLGAERERVEAKLERPRQWVNRGWQKADGLVCPPDDVGCIEGEQFLRYEITDPAHRSRATVEFSSGFIEDEMRLGRLTVRPGLRLSYDDYMRNHDLAPRLAASYDLFGDGRTLLIAGRNRYFGKTLLANGLLDEYDPKYRVRTSPDSTWINIALPGYGRSELKTPRTDETVAGFDQLLWGGVARIRYIERENEEEFAYEYDKANKAYHLNNNGSSRHREYRLAWERWWRRHYLMVNAAYQETESSNEGYNDRFTLADLAEEIWYDGDVIPLSELPRKDFNRPWVGNLVYSVRLPKGFTFTNVTRYRGGYRALKDTRKNKVLADGTEIDIYDEVKNSESWLFDWKVSWRGELGGNRAVQFDLEINNVFDRKIESGEDDSGDYELGRQFWAGIVFDF